MARPRRAASRHRLRFGHATALLSSSLLVVGGVATDGGLSASAGLKGGASREGAILEGISALKLPEHGCPDCSAHGGECALGQCLCGADRGGLSCNLQCEAGWGGYLCTSAACPCGPHTARARSRESVNVKRAGAARRATSPSANRAAAATASALPPACASAPKAGEGARCESATCADDCSGHGLCVAAGTCSCDDGWRGAKCAEPICIAGCSGHGACTSPGVCSCSPGWHGESCAQRLCPLGGAQGGEVCSRHGKCEASGCVCDEGWQGHACGEPACPSQCSSRGSCLSPGVCTCAAGWSGRACELPVCANGCSGDHGNCTSPGVCSCAAGWGGFDCSEPRCAHDCNEHGECVAPGVCDCVAGWTGDDCGERDAPSGSSGGAMGVRQRHAGTAAGLAEGTLASIAARNGVGGVSCLNNCSGGAHGTCDATGSCRCLQGWRGLDCSKPSCAGLGGCHEKAGQGICSRPGRLHVQRGLAGRRLRDVRMPGRLLGPRGMRGAKHVQLRAGVQRPGLLECSVPRRLRRRARSLCRAR